MIPLRFIQWWNALPQICAEMGCLVNSWPISNIPFLASASHKHKEEVNPPEENMYIIYIYIYMYIYQHHQKCRIQSWKHQESGTLKRWKISLECVQMITFSAHQCPRQVTSTSYVKVEDLTVQVGKRSDPKKQRLKFSPGFQIESKARFLWNCVSKFFSGCKIYIFIYIYIYIYICIHILISI